MTHRQPFSFRRVVVGSIVAALLVVGTVHCGGSPSSSATASDGCRTVCACVSGKGGDRTTCMTQCADVAAKTTNPKGDCETSLANNGYSSCNSSCSALTSPGSSGGGGTATIADFCEKCAECVDEPGFKEGFCTPHRQSGGGFDLASCTSGAQSKKLSRPTLSKGELSAMSCSAFDDAE